MTEQQPQWQQPPSQWQPHPTRPWNGFAIASLVLGIVWVYWIGSICALVFGYISLKQIKDSNGWQQGRGLAIAGVVLGWVGIGTLILFIVAIVLSEANSSVTGY